MGDKQHGLARALPDLRQLDLKLFASLGVNRCEWLVEKQDIRVHGKRSGEVGALLHAAGKFRGVAPFEATQTDHIDKALHFIFMLRI